MDKFIKVYDDVIDEVSCDAIITKFEDSHEHFQTVHFEDDTNRISFEQITLVEHEEWEPVQNGLLELFQDYILHYKIDCDISTRMWPETYGYEAIRMKRYLNNDYDRFDPHVDVLNHETAKRFLSFFIYLNDVEEGGETEWYHQQLKLKPTQGTMVIWPTFFTHAHRGNRPISNTKYIINKWFFPKYG